MCVCVRACVCVCVCVCMCVCETEKEREGDISSQKCEPRMKIGLHCDFVHFELDNKSK